MDPQSMRDTFRALFFAALFFAAGCSRYDRELLGDPEPAQPRAESEYVEAADPAYAGEDSLGVGMFDELRFYGQWYWVDPYGWVWRPTVVTEWQPFMNGHWIWSQYGWMWVDYDPWGWATSHYGYWTTDFTMGWIWIPDYTWSPVQCNWLVYDDYVCWAPVPPPGVHRRDPWDADRGWVSVPVRRFKEQNVASYRETPKFKPDPAEHSIYRGAPDVYDVGRRGPKFSTIEVQLERHVVGDHEFAKVKYPPDQQQIISSQRVRTKTNNNSARFTEPAPAPQPLPPMTTDNGGGAVGPKPQPAKSKDSSTGNKDSGKKTERKYKDRGNDKKDGDKKDEGQSKSGKKG